MQWADLNSIRLLESMVLNTTMSRLLLVYAYRDNEVDAAHPFQLHLDDIAAKGKRLLSVNLKELNIDSVTGIIVDSFRCPQPQAASLADIVCSR